MFHFVVASTFYTASLEKPLERALGDSGHAASVLCVPYNQLQSFLLDPRSVVPEGTPCTVLLLLRVEDLIRLDLAALAGKTDGAQSACLCLLRERELQFLDVLSGISQLQMTVMVMPAGLGAYDTGFLGNAPRVTEYKIAAEVRRQQKHLLVDWREFAKAEKLSTWLSPTADRLGHVPFTPAGLQAVADFFVSRLDSLPTVTIEANSSAKDGLTLEKFLGSLDVVVSIAPLTSQDEQTARNLVRHTTHFINLTGAGWDKALTAGDTFAESWVVRVSDRFGNYGISGAVVFRIVAGKMLVDFFFLICPVLGKQVEHAVFSWMADVAEQHGAKVIEVPFVQGRDNKVLAGPLSRLSDELNIGHFTDLPPGAEKKFLLNVLDMKERIAGETLNREAFATTISKMKVSELATK
ncbi:MAG TPA: hypothetical protein VGD64_08980 [Acidisarcina sp.]